jgi:hypothetical protein
MKVALATIIKGDKYDLWFMEKIFPKFSHLFGGFLTRDSRTQGWNGNFAEAKNDLVRSAEENGYDWIFFMDADESMYKKDIEKILDYIWREVDDIIIQPRINFIADTTHIEDRTFPDYQGRVFKLNVGYHFQGEIHETVFKKPELINWHTKQSGYRAVDCPIYHYGLCKPEEEFNLKYWRRGEVYIPHLYLGDHPLKEHDIYR